MRRGRRRRPWLRVCGYEPIGRAKRREARRERYQAAQALDLLDEQRAVERGIPVEQIRRERAEKIIEELEASGFFTELGAKFAKVEVALVDGVSRAVKPIRTALDAMAAALSSARLGP